MRDTQVDQSGQFARIPILSTALHCVAMTVLVFLRSSFGYLYLRPRSLLFGMGWAVALFSVYAWLEPGMWTRYRAVCVYGLTAFALYCFHLGHSVWQQTQRKAVNDQHSGTSHLLRLLPTPDEGKARFEFMVHLWGEPILVLALATVLRVFGFFRLPTWLTVAAFCLFASELTNYWLTLRREKRQTDMMEEAAEKGDAGTEGMDIPAPKATRKPPRKRGPSGS